MPVLLLTDLLFCRGNIFTSTESQSPGGPIGQTGSIVRRRPFVRQHFQMNSLLKPVDRFLTKFHMQSPGVQETYSYSDGPGHITYMAIMPIYGKDLKTFFSKQNPIDQWPFNLVRSSIISVQLITMIVLKARSNLLSCRLMEKCQNIRLRFKIVAKKFV